MNTAVIANGKPIEAKLPCTLEDFLVAQRLLPSSIKVALAPAGAAV
jgi:hypothetical protein